MNREEFYNYIKDNLKSNLSEELRNGECVLSQVSKNNQILTGVTIHPNESGMQITPVVYLDNFYDRYESGYAAHEILNDIARIYENYAARSNSNDFSFKPDMVMDYNAAKDHIYPKVIGISGNETYLQDKVYRTIEDLAVTYYIDLSEDLNSIGGKPTVTISKTILEKYGVTEEEINETVESTFMLKHVFPSNDPVNRPGSYERAKELLRKILVQYAKGYSEDFGRLRQDEARFEISIKDALITGAIDLLMREDPEHGITTADVIDFKTMELPDSSGDFDWRDMSIQVQLYSKAAKEVMGEDVQTGFIHTLKDNKRTAIPVDDQSVENAIGAIEWAVSGILANDFPMRPCKVNCDHCDYRSMCAQKPQPFSRKEVPPYIHTPDGEKQIAAFDLEDEKNGH